MMTPGIATALADAIRRAKGGRRAAGGQTRIGRDTERKVLIESDSSVVRIDRIADGCRRVGANRLIPTRQPVDYFGTFCGSGRILIFDAKHVSGASVDFGDPKMFHPHQVIAIIRHGQAGAVAGFLIDSDRQGWLWWGWRELEAARERVKVTDARWDVLGAVGYSIGWGKLLEAR